MNKFVDEIDLCQKKLQLVRQTKIKKNSQIEREIEYLPFHKICKNN